MIKEIPIIDFSGFDSDNKKLRNSYEQYNRFNK